MLLTPSVAALLSYLMSWDCDGCEADAGGVLQGLHDGYACDKWFDVERTLHI